MCSTRNSSPLRCKVYIGCLGNNGSVQELGNAFSLFGPLTNVWVARNPPGFAFVDFEDPRHAEEAIRALNGTILCGRRVRVQFARKSRSSYRSPPPPRNDSQVICLCGEIGHHYRDCVMRRLQHLHLGINVVSEDSSESEESDSCSDYDWSSGMEWMTRNPSYHHDGGNSDGCQSRNSRPQEESMNIAWGQTRNNRSQDEPRNIAWRSRRNNSPCENHRNVASGIHRNNRPEREHRNARSRAQHSSSNTQCSPETASAIPTSSTSTPIDASNDVKCAICLDTVEDRMEYIPCGHGFHAKCSNDWLSVNGACPICRTKVASGNGDAQYDDDDEEEDDDDVGNFSQLAGVPDILYPRINTSLYW